MRYVMRSVVTSFPQRVLSTHMGNIYPNHKEITTTETILCTIQVLWTLWVPANLSVDPSLLGTPGPNAKPMKGAVAPSITLGIHVHKYFLHWALKSVNITYIGLFGSLGLYL